MMTADRIRAFLATARGSARREGGHYARSGRVEAPAVAGHLVTSLVRGSQRSTYDVGLWMEDGEFKWRCSCPSWRNPCKHVVATAVAVEDCLSEPEGHATRGPELNSALSALAAEETDAQVARTEALEERVLTARSEGARVRFADGAHLEVLGASDFPSVVTVRGEDDGPHGCSCPDFEANRLHTCKHVERVRTFLRRRRKPLPRAFARAARKPRVFLHFGEMVEPRLFGTPKGRGAPMVRRAFDADGRPTRPFEADPGETAHALAAFGEHVEPDALAWLEAKAATIPRYVRKPRLALGRLRRKGLAPYPYQREGALFLATRGRALLADEMGLGKTIQAILAALSLRQAKASASTTTVVCPASLRGGWKAEIERWADETPVLLEGSATKRADVIATRPRWLITHYEQVLRDHRAHRDAPPSLLVLDEAQRAKGLQAKTARALKSIPARYLFALTGTPLENRLEEAYAISQLIDQRLLPPLWQIDRDHFVRDPDRPRAVLLYRDVGALRSRLAPAFLRRRKEDVLPDLPERLVGTSRLPMHPAVEATYDDAITEIARILQRSHLRPGDIERVMRLFVIARRCCNGPHMLGIDVADAEVPKLEELRQALRELCGGEGRKVVVFSEWTDMTDRVEALSRKLGLPTFHLKGGVPVKRRPAMIRAFTETDGPAVFVSTDAGGVGLNLQAADAVVNLDLPWNPAKLDQRVARVHRIGSKETVRVLLLLTEDSVEERIFALHDTKRDVFANVWNDDGVELVTAPGGSGALRDLLRTLLADALADSDGEDVVVEEEVAAGGRPQAVAPEPVQAAATAGSLVFPGSGATAHELAPAELANAVATAAAAVAPALPPEHRASLASVFRALADALGTDDPEDRSPAGQGAATP
jgi:superfamily II DNA or RNA helicase